MQGKVVFITGGANGIGAAVARRLCAANAKVVLTDVDEAPLQALAAELGADRALPVVADVRDLDAMETAAAAAVERFGGIDVVLANAGIASFGSVLAVDPDAFRAVVDVNLMGVFHTVRATLPSVLDGRGYVLVVSSMAAYAAAPGMSPYTATKAAVENFTTALRGEVAHLGVAVGSAHMSWIDTPLVRESRAELASFGAMLDGLPGPLRKTTSVDECADAFMAGIEGRRRRVNCPGWVGMMRWLKPVLSSRLGERQTLAHAAEAIASVDADVATLGRSLSKRTETLNAR